MIFPEKWKCIKVYWAIMVKMKSKHPFILILPRIENIYTYETIEIRLLLTCYRSIGSIVYTQGRRLGSDQDGLSGNNRSAAGRLGRRDDEKLQRLVDFHRPIRSEGRKPDDSRRGFRIYEVRKRVVRNRRAVRKSEQIVYRPERERWTGAEENRYRNDGRRCFHKYRYYTGKCTSDHSERMILACILCIFLSYRRRRRLFGSK